MAHGATARSSPGERVGVREWCSWPETFAKTVRGRAPARFWLSMRASYGDLASCVERVPRRAATSGGRAAHGGVHFEVEAGAPLRAGFDLQFRPHRPYQLAADGEPEPRAGGVLALGGRGPPHRSEEHTAELQSQPNIACRPLP